MKKMKWTVVSSDLFSDGTWQSTSSQRDAHYRAILETHGGDTAYPEHAFLYKGIPGEDLTLVATYENGVKKK